MAIKVFDGTDNTFSTNGEIVLNPTRAIVHKEDNGSFYLDLETPLTQETKYVAPEEGSSATINGSGQIQNVDSTKESELVSLKGDTYQYTTTGKNKMPYSSYNTTDNRVLNMPNLVLPANTYTISFDLDSFSLGSTTSFVLYMGLFFEDNSGKDIMLITLNSNVNLGRKNVSFTTTKNVVENANTNIRIGATDYSNNARVKISNIQIESGATATSYEPYTGGQASPSPTYPQSIDIVSGLQEVEIVGKNLWNKGNSYEWNWTSATWYFINGVVGAYGSNIGTKTTYKYYLEQGNIYYFKFTIDDDSKIYGSRLTWSDETSSGVQRISSSASTGEVVYKITATRNDYIIPSFSTYNQEQSTIKIYNVQLEKDNNTTYEQYKGNTYDINLGKNIFDLQVWVDNPITYHGASGTIQNNTIYIDNSVGVDSYTSTGVITSGNLPSGQRPYAIKVKPNTKYTLSFIASYQGITGGLSCYYTLLDSAYNYITFNNMGNISPNVKKELEITTTNTTNYLTFRLGATQSVSEITYSEIQIEEGKYTSYSEYFEPIELCKIGTYQDKIFKGKGVNLFNKDDLLGGWVRATDGAVLEQYTDTYNYLPFLKVEPNTSYTIDLYSATGLGSGGICEYSSDNASSFIKGTAETQRVITFTTTPTTQYIRFCVRVDSKDKVMLLKGSITFSDLPTYEPYNAKDKWLLHKEIGKYQFTGNESWTISTNSSYSYYMFGLVNMLNYFPNYARISGNTTKSNKYKGGNNVAGSAVVFSQGNYLCCFRYNTGDSINAFYITSNISDTTTFKTEVKDTIVYYVLANPTTTEIDNSELVSELNALELIGGLNNISLSSSYLTGAIDLKYNFVSGGETTAKYIDYLQANNILVANTPQGNQAFRISNVERTRSKIRLKANHIFYDTQNYVIKDSYVVEKNCNQALDHLNDATDNTSPFSMTSDITTLNSYRCVRKSLYEAIQVVLERWGGHLIRDNFDIKVMSSIGNDNGVVVRYGKNLKNISATYNWDAVATKLMPVGKDGLLLPEEYLYASVQYDIPYTKVISFDQNNIVEDDYADADAYQQALVDDLRQKGMEYLASNSIPMVNYTLNANLERITDIGDTIEVIDERLGINLLTNLISYEYNCILDKYTQVQFGNFTPKLQNLMETIASNTEKAIEENNGVIQITLENELTEATDRIWGVLGNSYVIYEGDKILVVDELPKENAHNVIMINSGGIGFSQTGINGTFQSAWTIDNTLNMENINVINLTADLIKGGILKLGSNLNQYGQIEIYNEANNLIAELNKNGFKMYGTDGSYVLMNTQVGFAGYDRNDNKIYWADGDAFHMKKSEVEEEITLCGKMRYIPIHLTDTYGIEHNGIGLVSVLGGGN